MNGSLPRDFAALVLCGGESRRMGRSKACLPFGRETLLERVVRQVGQAVSETIVVAAVDQALPTLAGAVRVVRDERPQAGPLAGLSAGLKALGAHTAAVYVTGCDFPFVQPAFMARLRSLLRGFDCVVPCAGGIEQPLAGVYRAGIGRVVEDCLNGEKPSLRRLLERLDTQRIDSDELRDVDPRLESLINCNTPEEYRMALATATVASEPPSISADRE
ncbi:MAG TPA: molybdenum cofactor guanylyltransferase [Pirellulales bacterium]|nr:molybdenum cofactor guanylyltransferase [Pirellulales bacterium]